MDIPRTSLGIRWLAFTVAVVISAAMVWMAVRHGMAEHWAQTSQFNQWQHAAAWEPDNPENWNRIGRYYQVGFERSDASQAVANYERAATIAPGSAEYWLDLAEAQETARHLGPAEKAFRKAQQVYPISADVAWRFGNFLLRQNRQEEAYQQIHAALSVQPGLTALAISRCWQSTGNVEQILKLALPANSDAYWGAIDFFVDAREPDAAMEVWKRLIALHPSFTLQKSFHLEDMLVETAHAEDARAVWQQSLTASATSVNPQKDGSLVWNGGFEQDLLNGGLGWRFRAVPGADMSFDPRVVHSQGRSLHVFFDGTVNVDFQQPWQYVVVQPNTRYRLSAYFQTEGLTSSSGVRLELDETHFGDTVAAISDLPEAEAWSAGETEFTTGPEMRLLRLVLRRRPSSKLDNKINGSLWMDDVSLAPLIESSALR